MDQELFFTSPLRDYVTMNDIAREAGASIEGVRAILQQHAIHPACRRGVVRLWTRDTVDLVRRLLPADS